MSKNGNRYANEFKQQIVDLHLSGIAVAKLSDEYGVSEQTIYQWIKLLSPIKIDEKTTISMKEYKLLQKKITQLEIENEMLKKATAIFARKQ